MAFPHGYSTENHRFGLPFSEFCVTWISDLPQMKLRDILFWLASCLLWTFTVSARPSTLIRNILLIDGSGKQPYPASVRVQDHKISAIGDLKALKNEKVIDGHGLCLAPGFIDSHSHHFADVQRNPNALSTASQGITTIVIGQDGESLPMAEIQQKLRSNPVAVHIASYTGHTALREQAMGEKNLLRPASQTEIDAMKKLLSADLAEGSLGLSTGLEYEGAFYSTRDEVMQLAQITAASHGRYISHIRSEDITLADALDEIIQIGRIAKIPVQISHIKLAKKGDWGQAATILQQLEQARQAGIEIIADIYPYNFWHSTPRILFPKRDYKNLASAEFATQELFEPSGSTLVRYAPKPEYAGKTIAQIAQLRNESPAQTLMAIIALSEEFREKNPNYPGTVEAITGKSMLDADVTTFLQWPHANICSDGNAGAHPRGYGTFTRILGRYVHEAQALTLAEAIHKMTGLTAKHLGIQDRGLIAPGKIADLVLFDPKTVLDHATIAEPQALSTGIQRVWVNGEIVYQNQQSTGKRPGTLIKRTHE